MFPNAKEVEDQLSSMHRKMIDVKSAFETIDIIKIKCIEEVHSYTPSIYICTYVQCFIIFIATYHMHECIVYIKFLQSKVFAASKEFA